MKMMKNASFCLLLVTAFLMALAPFAQARPRQRAHSGTCTRSGPGGRASSGTYSGQGSRQFLPGQGVEGDYSGQVTTQQGQTWNLKGQPIRRTTTINPHP